MGQALRYRFSHLEGLIHVVFCRPLFTNTPDKSDHSFDTITSLDLCCGIDLMDMHTPSKDQLEDLPRVIVLCGPTAVGKTALSLALARALDAEIVGMDSVQLYRELNIGSGKASAQERAQIPHHLIDVVAPDYPYDVGQYKQDAMDAIAEIHARGRAVILVGGTGMYLRVIVHGLFEAPTPDPAIRERLSQEAIRDGGEVMHARLARVDPDLANRLHVNDIMRISRGLEVFEQTGRPLSVMQREHQFKAPHFNALKIALIRPRPQLHARINARVDLMMEQGFVQECSDLYERYPRDTKSLQSLGYRQVAAHVFGEQSLEEVTEATKQRTRRYAKQQIGWLRSEPGVHWIEAPVLSEDGHVPEALLRDCARFLQGETPTYEWSTVDSNAEPTRPVVPS